jgi:hypothetical protein
VQEEALSAFVDELAARGRLIEGEEEERARRLT